MERKQFETNVAVVRNRVCFVALSYLNDEAEAEDVTQDALLKLWTVRERVDDSRHLMALAVVITKNLCVDRLRRAKTSRVVPLGDDADGLCDALDVRNGQMAMEDAENDVWFKTAEGKLPNSYRTILRMSQNEGLENREIARITGMSEASVRGMLSQARKRMFEQLKRRNRQL